jgi:hypothetical protein
MCYSHKRNYGKQSSEKKRELHEWALLSSQGKAVKNFVGDKLGNAWLYDPRMLKSGQFITAWQMRSNVAANKVALDRARSLPDLNCRKCWAEEETLGHILGMCLYTKKQRIHWHDEIKDFILDLTIKHNKETVV